VSSPSTISLSARNEATETGVYVSLGSNLGLDGVPPQALLGAAITMLELGGDEIIATSSFWSSDAWPAEAGAPNFVNAVCRIYPYDNDPALLLKRLHDIEAKFGRLRDPQNRWSERTLDLDLLDYNGLISKNNSFPVLPHPRMEARDFVLRPLLELSPNWVHPIIQQKGSSLLALLEKANELNNCIQL
jgi:2-amino-4-hydroxy-6-hydroxymethyldihydropteridine diphosphokinase